jgi:hypothetical protein
MIYKLKNAGCRVYEGMNPTPYKAIEGVYEEVESLLSKEKDGGDH